MNVAVRPDSLNLLSLCTGGGGLDLGVELAIPCARSVCMVEREAFAVAQLVAAMEAGHLAPAPVWSDARTFDGRAWRGCVDGLIGGIPCQPHSLAGKRLERADPRDLWSTARRIIVQSGAWFVLIENVEGMLSSGGAERVWRDLGRLGFACEVGLFTAAEVGASHKRERTFILAVADPISERGCRRNAGGQDAEDADPAGEGVVDTPSLGWGEGRAEPELRGGRRAATGSERAVAFPDRSGQSSFSISNGRRSGDESRLHAGRDVDGRDTHLFPPGPGALDDWRAVLTRSPELEPAFRRVADGLASRLDIARVDRLRLLGNGVVPLQAAYALRTLVARLAARGSAGAAELARMMDAA